ncbi:rRNA maturation RNase YbeY [bacterium]|nr:rRNA maturation RNase YbeY [bacterium]|tara:strand:- start:5403 stop:5822 length:420 start_codon:yes stop_codon:yes gene_type:complete
MPLLIDDSNIKIKSINKTILKRTLIKVIKYLKIEKKEINIVFLNDVNMKKLNKKYSGSNKSTDVLSFLIDGHDKSLLGDVFISIEYARANCLVSKNSLIKEVKILCIHGILHLIGLDHKNEAEGKRMFKIQDELYEKFK